VNLQESRVLITLTRRQASAELAERLVEAGASGVRLIAKGYRPAEYRADYDALVHGAQSSDEPFRVIVDLPGGKPRISAFTDDFEVERGQRVALHPESDLVPDGGAVRRVATVGLMPFLTLLEPGHRVLVADGSIEMRVIQVDAANYVLVEVMNDGGVITASRSINLPDSKARYSSRGDDDGTLVAFGRDERVEVAVSMASAPNDVERIRRMLPSAYVVAKIETYAGIANLNALARAADELLIARGDLSIELPLPSLGSSTQQIVDACQRAEKPYMLAAGMLDSVQRTDRPSIAEVSELWHFHRSGVRQFLLSGTVCVTNPIEATRWARTLLDSYDREAALGGPLERGRSRR
jgi:pyruvate kinase